LVDGASLVSDRLLEVPHSTTSSQLSVVYSKNRTATINMT